MSIGRLFSPVDRWNDDAIAKRFPTLDRTTRNTWFIHYIVHSRVWDFQWGFSQDKLLVREAILVLWHVFRRTETAVQQQSVEGPKQEGSILKGTRVCLCVPVWLISLPLLYMSNPSASREIIIQGWQLRDFISTGHQSSKLIDETSRQVITVMPLSASDSGRQSIASDPGNLSTPSVANNLSIQAMEALLRWGWGRFQSDQKASSPCFLLWSSWNTPYSARTHQNRPQGSSKEPSASRRMLFWFAQTTPSVQS